jgi:Voltage-dependent anion channel
LLGIFFYFVLISLILYRLLFEPMRPAQFTPPCWINMGAVAIATLAGARLEAIAGPYPLLARLIPAITIATILSWAVASWWVPLLTALMFWRHVIRGVRLSYHLQYWSLVFPLGMYTELRSPVPPRFSEFNPRVFSLDCFRRLARHLCWNGTTRSAGPLIVQRDQSSIDYGPDQPVRGPPPRRVDESSPQEEISARADDDLRRLPYLALEKL